ncbi:hypothetical protein AB3X96_15975 [Paraburkholderia sp. BR13439]|uniref:hypothetical protein n=1 Tax=Paraburkholderia sp. BR13439 TaxID=3236996 RepID=UPI0034CECEE0
MKQPDLIEPLQLYVMQLLGAVEADMLSEDHALRRSMEARSGGQLLSLDRSHACS